MTWNLAPVFHIVQKIRENYCPCLYLSIGPVWWLNKLWFKRYIQKCTLFHVLILTMTSDLVNCGTFQNTDIWTSQEQNTTFLQNKKILNLHLRWLILRNCFVAEVIFNRSWFLIYDEVLNFQDWIFCHEPYHDKIKR